MHKWLERFQERCVNTRNHFHEPTQVERGAIVLHAHMVRKAKNQRRVERFNKGR
jgi:hypothetical protein